MLKLGLGLSLPFNKTLKEDSPSYPIIIEDGNTVGLYLSDDLTTITKDGSDFVSAWNDKLGSGHDLLQAIGTNQPKWVSEDGILFDGINDFLKTNTFTFNQPEFIYIVFKQVTWTNNDRIFDGNVANNTGAIFQSYTSPGIRISASSPSTENSDLQLNTFSILRMLFNGASSKYRVNELTPFIGDFGSANMGGFTIGSSGTAILWSNIQVKEIILRKISDTAQDEQDIYDYLANKYTI